MSHRAVRGIIVAGEFVFRIASREKHVSRRDTIKINRHSTWNGLYDSFGLSRKVLPETNPVSRHITSVEVSKVRALPCRDYRGRPLRGIDMVRRYAEFDDVRTHYLRNVLRNMILRCISPLFGCDTYIPLDAAFFDYCDGRAEILDDIVERVGHKNPHFFLDGSLIPYPSWEDPSIIEIHRGYRSIYAGTLTSAKKLRGASDFSLALGG